jgi:hypothetical protein
MPVLIIIYIYTPSPAYTIRVIYADNTELFTTAIIITITGLGLGLELPWYCCAVRAVPVTFRYCLQYHRQAVHMPTAVAVVAHEHLPADT